MFKLIAASAAASILPKLFDKVSDSVVELYDSVFGEEKHVPIEHPRKKRDTTPFTQEMAEVIINHHDMYEGTRYEHTTQLNKILGLDKSVSAYARIWNPNFNIKILPKGEKIV